MNILYILHILYILSERLQQRYKSKWKHKKQTKEQKEEMHEAQKTEREEKKRKHFEDSKAELLKVVQTCPTQDANLQDRRDWDLKVQEKLQELLSSPRARKKN